MGHSQCPGAGADSTFVKSALAGTVSKGGGQQNRLHVVLESVTIASNYGLKLSTSDNAPPHVEEHSHPNQISPPCGRTRDPEPL